jgi:hypothetical protein
MPSSSGILSSIAAAQQKGSRGVELWAVDAGGEIWTTYQLTTGGAWSGWEGPGFKGQPVRAWQVAAADQNTGSLMLFMLDLDGSVWTIPQGSPGGDWGGWAGPGVQGQSAPFSAITAAQQGGSRGVELWGLDPAGQIWTLYQVSAGGAWSAWEGPGFKGQPSAMTRIAAAGQNNGRVSLFTLDASGAVWTIGQSSPGGDWTGWSGPNVGGQSVPFKEIAAAQQGGPRGVELWATDAAGNIWTLYQTTAGGAWSRWEGPGFKSQTIPAEGLAAAGQNNGEVALFSLGRDRSLNLIGQTSPGGDWGGWSVKAPLANPAAGWDTVGSGGAKVLSGGNLLFMVDAATSAISQFSGVPNSWTRIGDPAHDFAGTEDALYSITTAKDAVMTWSSTAAQWTRVGPGMERLIPARHRLHAVDAQGKVWMYGGAPDQWTMIGGPFLAVDANDEFCFAVSADGTSTLALPAGQTSWTTIGGGFSSLIAAGNALYGIDASGVVSLYGGKPMAWTVIGQGFAQLEAWGVRLFGLKSDKRQVLELRNDLGGRWQPVAGDADTICAGMGYVAALSQGTVLLHMLDDNDLVPTVAASAPHRSLAAATASSTTNPASAYNWLFQFQTADKVAAGYDGYIEAGVLNRGIGRLNRTHFDRNSNYVFPMKYGFDDLPALSLRGENHFLPDHWTVATASAWNFNTGKLYSFDINADVPNEYEDGFNYLTVNPSSVTTTQAHTGPSHIYIWSYVGFYDAVGHAAMKLSDGTYISWWPQGGPERKYFPLIGLTYSAPHNDPQTQQDDETFEGKPADLVLSVWNLDEAAIKAWWGPYNADASHTWNALNANCSTVVFNALQTGGALNVLTPSEREEYANNAPWTPNDVARLVMFLQSKQ